ncbi:hypothetical protein [Pseudomonas sp. CGJS7]|uniref:hypothetical protein n=1 Tax=Pseudomonas sp. CGJS7 TaxID=3109348 RepID=UPI00300A7DC0
MSLTFASRLGLLAVPLLCAVASSAAAIEPFVLVDSNGKTVGPILDMPHGDSHMARIPFRVGNQRITLVMAPGGLTGSGTVYFEADTCSSQPYMLASGGLLTDIEYTRDRALVPDGPARLVSVRSFSSTLSGGCTRLPTPDHDPYLPARDLVGLSTRFTPPFRIQASDEVIDLDVPAN